MVAHKFNKQITNIFELHIFSSINVKNILTFFYLNSLTCIMSPEHYCGSRTLDFNGSRHNIISQKPQTCLHLQYIATALYNYSTTMQHCEINTSEAWVTIAHKHEAVYSFSKACRIIPHWLTSRQS